MSTGMPRGWTYATTSTAGITASITVPAIPGVAHVLTGANASMLGSPTHPAVASALIINGIGYGSMLLPGVSGSYETDSYAWSGELLIPVNTSLIVTIQYSNTNVTQTLDLAGYDL
jgi:hypothetical protein